MPCYVLLGSSNQGDVIDAAAYTSNSPSIYGGFAIQFTLGFTMGNRDIRAFKILFWILFPICFVSFIHKPSIQLGLWCLLFIFVLAPVVFNLKRTNKIQIDATTEGINLTSKDWPLFSILGFILPLIATILSRPATTFSALFLFGVFSFVGVIATISFLACMNALGNKTHEK